MFNNLEKKLRAVRPKPLTMKEKNLLWSNIEKEIEASKIKTSSSARDILGWNLTRFKKKFILVPALIVALLGGGTITAFASDQAKPGDALFPVDLAIEKLQIIIAPKTKEAELRIKFAKERFEEAKIILATLEKDYTNTTSSKSATATSTATASTTQQSANGTASTTATSTTSDIETSHTDDKNVEEHRKKAAYNFGTALELLEQIKTTLENNDDESSAIAVERLIDELNTIAEKRPLVIEKFKADIKKGGEKVHIEIKVSSDENNLKFKLKKDKNNQKLEIKVSNKKEEDKHDDRRSKTEIDNEDKNESDTDNGHNDEDKHEEKKHEDDKKIKICHKTSVNATSNKERTIHISKNALEAHLDHGDVIGECREDRNEHGEDNDEHENEDSEDSGTTTTSDNTAPVISNVTADATITTSKIVWDTDEPATSSLWYSTTTPIITADIEPIISSGLKKEHSITVSSLTASTTYYFITGSVDDSGNAATSTEQSFTTLQEKDIAPPEISNISANAAIR
jgi:hypothetical protein